MSQFLFFCILFVFQITFSYDGESTSSKIKRIAIIDTGFAVNHPKLDAVIDRSAGFYAAAPYDSQQNYADQLDEPIIASTGRSNFHGTHVSGIAAQYFGKIRGGVIRSIIPVKVSAESDRRLDFMYALNYVRSLSDIVVVNLSWGFGGKQYRKPIHKLIEKAMLDVMASGKIIVLSSGNTGNCYSSDPYTKSVINLAKKAKGRLIIVGAYSVHCEYGTSLAPFSAYADKKIAPYFITAPGDDISSYVPTSLQPDGDGVSSGTSMAAPAVSGLIARIATDFPLLTVDEISKLVRESSEKIVDRNGDVLIKYGCGILDTDFSYRVCGYRYLQKWFHHKHKIEYLRFVRFRSHVGHVLFDMRSKLQKNQWEIGCYLTMRYLNWLVAYNYYLMSFYQDLENRWVYLAKDFYCPAD